MTDHPAEAPDLIDHLNQRGWTYYENRWTDGRWYVDFKRDNKISRAVRADRAAAVEAAGRPIVGQGS